MQLLKPVWISRDGHPLFSVDLHPDGSRLAAAGHSGDSQGASQAGRISIWNMRPILDVAASKNPDVPKLLCQLDHHLGCVNCVRWSTDGKRLASGGDDKLVMIWEKSPYGGGAVFGGGGAKVNVESWRCVKTLRGHSGDVLDLAWAPNDAFLATASVDNSIIIWNPDNFPEILHTLTGHSGLVKGVSFDPVGKYLASQSDDRSLRIWRTSDWKEEACVTGPFEECGSTTHVLRPGWSPDGSALVSAHAMNGGGPTAQIVNRDTWELGLDFVGHKKAVTAVRFNSRIFLRPGSDDGKENQKDNNKDISGDVHALCAVGSRDRSFSVWSTRKKRPFLVLSDAFDQSVLDLSWSKNGKVLVACSMDGSLACVILSEEETGTPISEQRLADMMAKKYGSGYGIPVKKAKKSNGTAVFVENPELLLNGENNKNGPSLANGIKKPLQPPKQPKGPTDKQIGALTSDGKRRITPMYIPPDSEMTPDSSEAPKAGDFGSSSTQEKSKIEIEKRTEIVVRHSTNSNSNSFSPGDKKTAPPPNDGKPAPPPSSEKEKKSLVPEPEPSKKKKAIESSSEESSSEDESSSSEEEEQKAPKVNVLSVKRKPGPARGRIIVSDSSGDDADPRPLPSSEPPKSHPKPKDDQAVIAAANKNSKFKDLMGGKPGLGVEENSGLIPKKRPLQDENSEEGPPPSKRRGRQIDYDVQQQQQLYSLEAVNAASANTAVLPPMRITRAKTFSVTLSGQSFILTVKNRFYSAVQGEKFVHLIKCEEVQGPSRTEVWSTVLSSEINAVVKCADSVAVCCIDASFHVFNAKGERRFPALMLPAALTKVSTDGDLICAITTNARFFLWRLHVSTGLEALQRNECVLSLLQPAEGSATAVSVLRLSFSEDDAKRPVVFTSAMKTFAWSAAAGAWIKLADAANSVQALSNYSSPRGLPPSTACGYPLLSSLNLHSAPAPKPTANGTSSSQGEIRSLANLSFCEEMRAGATFSQAPKEYRYWLLNIIRHLATSAGVEAEKAKENTGDNNGDTSVPTTTKTAELKLRAHLDDLMGPSSEPPSDTPPTWEPRVLGLDKRDLFRDALKIVAENVQLQRLHMEYADLSNRRQGENEDPAAAMEVEAIFE